MKSESTENVIQQLLPVVVIDTRGKHRISAELKRLEQETRFLETRDTLHITAEDGIFDRNHGGLSSHSEELEKLERIENASVACKEMLSILETKPDPLLPLTYGPINPLWDRWFEGPQESRGCRCWIL